MASEQLFRSSSRRRGGPLTDDGREMLRRAARRSAAAALTAAATAEEKLQTPAACGRSFRCRLLPGIKERGSVQGVGDFHIAVPTEIKKRPSVLFSTSPAEHVSFFKGLPAADAPLKYLREEKKRVVGGIAGGGRGVIRRIHMSNLTPVCQTQFPAHV